MPGGSAVVSTASFLFWCQDVEWFLCFCVRGFVCGGRFRWSCYFKGVCCSFLRGRRWAGFLSSVLATTSISQYSYPPVVFSPFWLGCALHPALPELWWAGRGAICFCFRETPLWFRVLLLVLPGAFLVLCSRRHFEPSLRCWSGWTWSDFWFPFRSRGLAWGSLAGATRLTGTCPSVAGLPCSVFRWGNCSWSTA